MSQAGPWNDRGMDRRARDAASEAALSEGLSLSQYLSRMLQEEAVTGETMPPAYARGPQAHSGREHSAEDAIRAIERLSHRIEASEARSTQAISGIDRTVLGLVARIDSSEQTTAAVASHIDGLIEQMRSTHDALQAKVRRLEQDDTGQQNLEALKTLEAALGKLAGHVYAEAELVQNESQAIRGRMEAGLGDMTERLETLETRVERRLSEVSGQAERGLRDSEDHLRRLAARQDDTARQLLSGLERFGSTIPREIETRIGRETQALSGALASVETTLTRVQQRLSRAETNTDTALKGLETSFASLDERISAIASKADPELAERLRMEFAARFDDVTQFVRSAVETARREIAEEIARASDKEGRSHENLRMQLETVRADLADLAARPAEVPGASLREEIEQLETRLSARMDDLAENVSTRLEEGEIRSADAIEQVGEQVTVAAIRLQKRQDEALTGLLNRLENSEAQAEARLSDALADVSERMEEIGTRSVQALSPVQRAIAALASRLENLESIGPDPSHAMPAATFTAARRTADTTIDHQARKGPPEGQPPAPIPASYEAAQGTWHEESRTDLPEYDDPDEEGFEAGLDNWATGTGAWHDPDDSAHPSSAQEATPYRTDFEAIRAAADRLTSVRSNQDSEPPLRARPDGDLISPDYLPLDSFPDPDEDGYDPFEEVVGLEEARSETRESDIFDSWEEPPPAAPENPSGSFASDRRSDPGAGQTTDDYMARARHAAIAAAGAAHAARLRADSPAEKTAGLARTPIYLAATAMLLGGAGTGTFLYLRGKQAPEPSLSVSTGTYQAPQPTLASPAQTASQDEVLDMAGILVAPGLMDAEPAMPEELLAQPAEQSDMPGINEIEAVLFDDAADPASGLSQSGLSETGTPQTGEPDTAPTVLDAAVTQTPPPATLASLTQPRAQTYPPIPAIVSVESEASAGNAIAQYQLAQNLVSRGEVEAAIPLLRRAGVRGIAPAQYDLGKLLENGLGVPQDLAEARRLMAQAAEAGHVGAMYDLALFMAEGEGGPTSPSEAIAWFRRAADHGFTDAQYNLGVMYAEGLGSEKNLAEALYWFELAARLGDEGAATEAQALSLRLSADIVSAANRRAERWEQVPPSALANGQFGPQRWNAGNPLQVRAIQTALARLGFLDAAPDGILGPQTSAAIRQYQGSEGLNVSGSITAELIDRLNAGAGGG